MIANILFIGLIVLDIVFLMLIRNNFYNVYIKTLYGKTIEAKVIKCKEIPSWFSSLYCLTIEYEIDNQRKNKKFFTNNEFARQYTYLRNTGIELVLLPETNKVYLKEGEWRRENFIYFVVIFMVTLLFFIFIMFFISIFVGTFLMLFS